MSLKNPGACVLTIAVERRESRMRKGRARAPLQPLKRPAVHGALRRRGAVIAKISSIDRGRSASRTRAMTSSTR